jgi:flagellar hook-basal body complex protein FliE
MPVDPTFAIGGPEWRVDGIGGVEGATPGPASGGSFGGALADQIGKLDAIQQDAAKAAQDLASGRAEDPSATVMAIERARLSMQLAAQIRTKGVEALQEVLRTTV